MNEASEKSYEAALANYYKARTEDPEIAFPVDVFADWNDDQSIGLFLTEADRTACGSYVHSSDQLRSKLAPDWDALDVQAQQAYDRTYKQILETRTFSDDELMEFVKDANEVLNRIAALGEEEDTIDEIHEFLADIVAIIIDGDDGDTARMKAITNG